MKFLVVLLIVLALPGCEKRVPDPEMSEVREWLLSMEGRKALASRFEEMDEPKLDQLEACEKWALKRAAFDVGFEGFEGAAFLVLAGEREKERKWALVLFRLPGDEYLIASRFSVTLAELEFLGDPVSLKKVDEFFLSEY
ncbi:MAG: hypothetical protein AAF514_00050 [Verrucomicrobiota bacterium]